MVLSEEEQMDAYPAATMEPAQSSVETAYYSNVEETRTAKPAGYPLDSYTDPNNYVSKLNGNGNKVGTGIVLRVMSGDKVNIRASSWYYLNGADPGTPVNPLNDLLNVLATGVTTVVTDLGKFTRTELISNGILNPGVGSMLDQQTASYSNTTKPKAYLSWLLLDEQFKLVGSSSGFEQVGADGEFKTWVKSNLPINRNGYLYVYTSNESPVDVFFDNLQVSHIRGPLLEETHYYPFGLTMAGISSKAAGKLENRFKYNGIEQNTDLDLNQYDAFYRTLDPQIGRWWQIDPQTDNNLQEFSPYSSMRNNPIIRNDPLGDFDNYVIKESGKIEREITADKTDNFKYQKKDGTSVDLGTFEKNDKGLAKVPKEGMNFKNFNKSGKDFVEGFTLAAILGAAYEFKQKTGFDIQINQLNNSEGGHSSHGGFGQFADIRYVNKNGNIDEGSIWTDNALGLNNYDADKSQTLVDMFQKFGFKNSSGKVSILTENANGNAPALNGTHFPGHGKAPNFYHHRHHIHLQHNINFLNKNKKP